MATPRGGDRRWQHPEGEVGSRWKHPEGEIGDGNTPRGKSEMATPREGDRQEILAVIRYDGTRGIETSPNHADTVAVMAGSESSTVLPLPYIHPYTLRIKTACNLQHVSRTKHKTVIYKSVKLADRGRWTPAPST